MKSSKTSFLRNCISGWNVRFPSNLSTSLSGQKVFVPLSPIYLLWVAVMCDLVVFAASYGGVARESYL